MTKKVYLQPMLNKKILTLRALCDNHCKGKKTLLLFEGHLKKIVSRPCRKKKLMLNEEKAFDVIIGDDLKPK